MRRIGKGLGASTLGQGTSVASRLLEVPLALAFWGIETYGVWLILTVIPTMLVASDFGVATVANRVMAREINSGRRDETVVTYQTTAVFSLMASLVLSTAAIGLFATGLLQPLLGLAGRVDWLTTVLVVALLSGRVLAQMISRVSQAGLFCVGEYPRGMLYTGAGEALKLVALFSVMAAGGGLVAAAALQLTVAVVMAIALQRSVGRHAPWLAMGVRRASWAKLRELSKPAMASFSIGISRAINYALPRVVVAAFGGPVATTIFHAHRQFARLINFMIVFGGAFRAEMALTYGRDDDRVFRELAARTVQLFVWLSLASAAAVAILATAFFGFWTRGAFPLDGLLLALLVATTLSEAFGSSALLPVAAINRHGSVASTFFVANAAAFAAAVPLTHFFGLYGMAAALLFVDAATTVRTYLVLADVLQQGFFRTVSLALRPPLWIIQMGRKALPQRFR